MDLIQEKELMNTIMDLGAALLANGADTHKTEKNLYRICRGYHFTNVNIWLVPSDIQASVTTPQGEDIALIRNIPNRSANYEKLADLNDLARRISAEPLDPGTLRQVFDEIRLRPDRPAYIFWIAAVLGCASYAVFFGGGPADAAVSALAAFLVSLVGRKLGVFEKNPLVYNFILSFIAELIILAAAKLGFGLHVGCTTIGVVMLLISGIGITIGIKDLMYLDTLSGMIRITESFLGAAGIAIGFGLPLFLFSSAAAGGSVFPNVSAVLQLISCAVGCIGFALWFNVKPKHLLLCAVGTLITWGIYLIAARYLRNDFIAAFIAASACALFAQVSARTAGAPSTIFMSVSIFPLLPGAALYYTMYGIVLSDTALAKEKGAVLLTTCFAIGLGMLVVEVIVRLFRKLIHRPKAGK